MAEEFQFQISKDIFSNLAENHTARDEYESSEEYNTDIQTENFRKEYAPIANKETAKIADDDDSGIFGATMNFGKHMGIGVAKGVEEIGQATRILEDDEWKLPKPKTTAEGIAQAFGQFLPGFIPVAGALGKVSRLAGIMEKSKKLRIARDGLISMSAGAVSDAVAFDPKDPNAANFLLSVGAIAQNPQASAALNALAQSDLDEEGTSRLKNSVTGIVAGAILGGVFKGTGYAFGKLKGKAKTIDDVPVKDIEEAAQVEAETIVEGVTKAKQTAQSPKQLEFDAPGFKGAAKDAFERERDDYVRPWEKLDPKKQEEAIGIVSRWARGEKVLDTDLETIESMNFLKLKGEEDIKHLMQFLSERMKVKQLLKGRIKTESFDTASGMADVLDVPEREAARLIEEQAGNVRGAIKFVGVARALGAAEMKKADDAFALFASGGQREVYEKALTHTKNAYDMLASGGELSKASSDLLRSHKKLIDQVDNADDLRAMVRHSVVYNDPELSVKQAGWFTSRKNVDDLKIKAKFKGGTTKTSKIKKKKGETDEELQERILLKARQTETESIEKANIKQLKGRLNAMNKSFIARTRDSLLEIYVNGLLSSIKTFEINALGNTTAIISSVIDRAYAGVIKQGGEITAREAAELGWGYLSALKDLKSLIKQSVDLEPTVNIKQDFIRPHDPVISKETWQVGGMLGKAIDYFGAAVNFPGRVLLSADEVFKAINYRAETRALAYRKAFNEVGDAATSADKTRISARFAEIMDNVEDFDDIVEQAKGFAAKNTYTNKLASHVIKDPLTGKDKVVPGLGLRLKGILDSDQTGIARTFIPFFQTPANLLNYAWERTPLLRKFNKGLQAELSPDAPAAVRELAEAKIATSNVLWASTIGLAMTGKFTGGPPRDPNLRKTLEADMGGAHWYSFIGPDGKWHKYDRFDPIGVIMAASAHAVVMGKAAWNLKGQYEQGDPSDEIFEKYKEVLEAGTIGMVRLITDRHYLQGFTEMLEILSPDVTGVSKLRRFGEKVAGFIDPRQGFYSSFRRNITAGVEPAKLERLQRTDLKDMNDFAKELGNIFEEGMRKVTPGYGERHAVKNLAGETVLFPGVNEEADRQPFQVMKNLASATFNPVPGLTRSKSPLINKLAKLESTIGQPAGVTKINGVTMTDDEKASFITTWTDMNKKLNALVKTKNFNKFPQGTQRLLLENMINSHKDKAKKLTLLKFPRLMNASLELKKNDIFRKTTQQVPQGFNFANLLGQQ